MKKHRGTSRKTTLSRALLFGIGISFAVLLTISLIFSGLVMTSSNPTGEVKAVSLATLLAAGAASGFIISRKMGDGGAFASLLSALAFIGIILAASLILTKGRVGGIVFMNCLCYLLVSVFFSFIAKKRHRHRRR